jgi:hypothetical protein
MQYITFCTVSFQPLMSPISSYREFLEWHTPVTLLPSARACETPTSYAEKNYCRLALHMPRILNTYVHFWK